MLKSRNVTKEQKMKKCKVCKKPFKPFNSLACVCSIDCSIQYAKDNKVQERVNNALNKAARAERKKAKDSIKTRSERLRDAQTAFNAYIRERDKNEPCISCGRYHTGQNHAGHYRTVGAHPELRFNELNCHLQCSVCNNHKSGNIVEYRINLVKKIGADKVEWLEGHHEPKKYSIEEIEQIKTTYRLKLRQLKRGEQC